MSFGVIKGKGQERAAGTVDGDQQADPLGKSALGDSLGDSLGGIASALAAGGEVASAPPADPGGGPIHRSATADAPSTDAPGSVFADATSGSGGAIPFRSEMERSFGQDFSGVSSFTGKSSQMESLSAEAATQGESIAFGTSSPSKSLVAHELTHVVQNRNAGVSGNVAASSTISRPSDGAEREADRVASDVAAGKSVEVSGAPSAGIHLKGKAKYATLDATAKAKVDSESQHAFDDKAQEWEFKAGPMMESDSNANDAANTMLKATQKIVDAWAQSTGQSKAAAYEAEFGWKGGDDYYGSFESTGKNIKKVFDNYKSQPLRKKLKIVYNAVRNNNFSKWLKIAALQLDAVAKGGKGTQPPIVKAISQDQGKDNSPVKGHDVAGTFAKDSGLDKFLNLKYSNSDGHVRDGVANIAQNEMLTDTNTGNKFVTAVQSNAVNWRVKQSDNQARIGGMNSGVDSANQSHLTRGDLQLTSAEQRLLEKRRLGGGYNNPNEKTTSSQKKAFNKDKGKTIDWSQGGEYYEVIPNSATDKVAYDFGARLEAGISGSTGLMMSAADYLSMTTPDRYKLRLGLAGWMMSNRDHSFYEILASAENFGVKAEFGTTKGAMYEEKGNYAPSSPSKFKSALPEKKFPAYFLSDEYKDKLAEKYVKGGANLALGTAKGEAKGAGISDDQVDNKLDARTTFELEALSKDVRAAGLETGADKDSKKNANNKLRLHRVRQRSAYKWLIHTYPEHADQWLGQAVEARVGKSALPIEYQGIGKSDDNATPLKDTKTDDQFITQLTTHGVPRQYVLGLPTDVLRLAATLDANVKAAGFSKAKDGSADAINTRIMADLRNTRHYGALRNYSTGPQSASATLLTLVQFHHGHEVLTAPADRDLLAGASLLRGPKQLTKEEISGLETPTEFKNHEDEYWETAASKDKLKKNISVAVPKALRTLKGEAKEKLIKLVLEADPTDQYGIVQAWTEEKDWESILAGASMFMDQGKITNEQIYELLPKQMADSIRGLTSLEDRELGAIFQYTTDYYKSIVGATSSMSNADFKRSEVTKDKSKAKTLKFAGPMITAINSGLAKLPIYPGPAFRIDETGMHLDKLSDPDRLTRGQQLHPVGSITRFPYVMSSAKSTNSEYIKTHWGGYDRMYEIEAGHTGRDIQYASDKMNEEEVLFAPGAAFKVVRVEANRGDKKLWVVMKQA
jgi:hypothetical protein